MIFDLQPNLSGQLLELLPLKKDHFDELYLVASDPLVWEQHPASNRYLKDVFQIFFDEALQGGAAFVVRDVTNGKIIGSTRYYELNLEKKEVAIGYTFLARAYWGGKYNREMKTLVLDHAFKFVDKAIFHVGEFNMRSQKAMAKIGGVVIGKEERSYPGRPNATNLVFLINRP